MVSNRLLNRLTIRILAFFTVIIIIFNEYIIYNINKKNWSNIECSTENCTRLLLVADPQILGETSDKMLFSTIALIDSDRYLQNTFKHALKFSKPHVICFLGDLLDEGSTATSEQYSVYVQRFKNIFYTDDSVKRVHIPGDNDIGGENGEYISNSNIRRFQIEFEYNDIDEYLNNNINIQFYKINRMLLDYTGNEIIKNDLNNINLNQIRIGLSHLPLLISGTTFLKNLLNDIDPHIIFSAHWHESRIFTYPFVKISQEIFDNRILEYDLINIKLKNEYLEIMIPTSSYRMGKENVGYGFAVIDNNILRYTVFWTYSRFPFLYLYLGWLILTILIICISQFALKCSKRLTKKYMNNAYERISLMSNKI